MGLWKRTPAAGQDNVLVKMAGRGQLLSGLHRLFDLAVTRFRETNIVEVSSSMTLATVLSIVPLLAVVLAVFSAVPAFAEYRRELEQLLTGALPGGYGEQIFQYLRIFSDHAKGLSAFGFAGLALSAYFLIDKMFSTINRIFRVRHRRSIPQTAILYWALLTLGPMIAVASISVTTYLAGKALAGLPGGASSWALNTLMFLLQVLFYTALYCLIPNCRVNRMNALFGGFCTASAGLVVKAGFSAYISGGTLGNLYGAFVALPVFILWIYVTWILVFAGAAVTATLPMLTSGRFADTYKAGNQLATGIGLLSELLRRKYEGEPVVPVRELCRAVDSWPEAASEVLEKLEAQGYVSHVASQGLRRSDAWVLVADPEKVTLRPAFDALAIDPTIKLFEKGRGPDDDWYWVLAESDCLSQPISRILGDPIRRAAVKD